MGVNTLLLGDEVIKVMNGDLPSKIKTPFLVITGGQDELCGSKLT